MNGISIKLHKTTSDGPDIETVYFATMRKEPRLRVQLRALIVSEGAIGAMGRRHAVASMALDAADTNEAIDKAAASVEAALIALDDAAQDLADRRHAFLKTGFQSAGYDDDSADRIASEIPPNRLSEIISASRIGAGMMDFSQPSKAVA
jgi:hypothetical protein